MEEETYCRRGWNEGGGGGGGGGGILKIVIAKGGGTIFICNYFGA